MKLRSPGGSRTPERERAVPGAPRGPRARRLQKARDERRTRLSLSGPGGGTRSPDQGGPVEITDVLPRTGEIAAAVVLFGGLLLIAMPQHGSTILRVVLVALAAVAALWATGALLPEAGVSGWWRSPFGSPDTGASARPSGEIARIRAGLSGRRRRIPNGRPLPPDTIRMLQPLIAVALDRAGLDADEETHRPAIRRALSPLAWSVLTSDLWYVPRWYETRRPDTHRVADIVRRVLDELERVAAGRSAAQADPRSPRPRAP